MVFSPAMRRVLLLAVPLALMVGCQTPIQHGLDEAAANEVVTALERHNIAAKKAADETGENAYKISVSNSDVGRAMELMRSLGLPRSKRHGLGETYSQPSLVPSATEERARFIEALRNDIERTLETIEGVVSARVHIVLAESDPLSADPKPRVPAQAAVLIKTKAGYSISLRESDIQKIVSGSVPGLTAAGVAVVVTSAPEWSGASAPTMIAVGPIRMTPGSKIVLMGAFAVLLGLVAILAMVLLFTARRLAAVQRAAARRG
jgi:type III secretion protein J